MCLFWIVNFLIIRYSYADMSPLQFCADVTPQYHVSIEQLMGMWYGIEILSHAPEERYYTRVVPSCPIVHISEDKTDINNYNYNSLYKGYGYDYNYGERQGDVYRTQYQYGRHFQRPDQYQQNNPYQHQNEYNRGQYGSNNYNNRRRYGNYDEYAIQQQRTEKKLRLWWDENGRGTEYKLRYNITQPGFWYSSGPLNGSELDPKYNYFAGAVQVIKAVGNHLVLTFCLRLPDKQLFTIILSRDVYLDKSDIHGVHSLLSRKGFRTNSVKKVCANGSFTIRLNSLLYIFVLLSCIYKMFGSNISYQ